MPARLHHNHHQIPLIKALVPAERVAGGHGVGLLNVQIQTTQFAPIKIRILPSNYTIIMAERAPRFVLHRRKMLFDIVILRASNSLCLSLLRWVWGN